MNVKMLKSKMVLCGDDDFVKCLANLLNVSRQTAAAKLNGTSEFTQTEIIIIAKHYEMTDEEIRKIFIESEDQHDSERSGKTT